MISFDELRSRWRWIPIRNCPGRFVLSSEDKGITPEDLVRGDAAFSEHRVETARDTVVVAEIDGGGLISYKRDDGSYLHTLNTTEGFERKLQAFGIGR